MLFVVGSRDEPELYLCTTVSLAKNQFQIVSLGALLQAETQDVLCISLVEFVRNTKDNTFMKDKVISKQ